MNACSLVPTKPAKGAKKIFGDFTCVTRYPKCYHVLLAGLPKSFNILAFVGFVGKTHISFVASVNFVGNRSAEEGTKKISVLRVL